MTPAAESRFRFRSGDVELDGLLAVPAGARRACVVCHPHPLYGGDMHSSVVAAMVRAFGEGGIATLRFDFRGVGASGGTHDDGRGETEDARAAFDALAAASGLAWVGLAGYSFGALIAMRAATVIEAGALIAVAPPLAMFDASFAAEIAAPMLMIAGDRDSYCPAAAFQSLASRLSARSNARLLPGADHFFAGREREVGGAAAEWLEQA